MKKGILKVIFIGLMSASNGICLSMQAEKGNLWIVSAISKAYIWTNQNDQNVPVVEPYTGTLDIFVKHKNGKDVCYALLQHGPSQTNNNETLQNEIVRLDGFPLEHFLAQNENSGQLSLKIFNQSANEVKSISIASWKILYGSKKYRDIDGCEIWANSDSIFIKKESDTITLYSPDNIRKIREILAKNSLFIMKLQDKDKKETLLRIGKYYNGSYLWWDGWKPMVFSQELNARCVGMPVFPNSTTTPEIMSIDLEQDKKFEPQYQRNKIVSRLLIMSFVGLMVWRFWDYLVALKDAIKADYSGPRPPYIIYRGNPHGVVVK